MDGLLCPAGLVFDMDGLLVDSEPLWFEVERAFARARGGELTAEQARACVGRGIASTLAFMHESFGFAVDLPRDTAEIVDAFCARTGELELKPGARELLAAAHGVVPLSVASSSARRLVLAVLSRFDLPPLFSAIVSGDEVASQKPAPDIFLLAAARMGVVPERCVVLEDSLAGATAGRAAGMRVIAVPEGDPRERGFEAVADWIVADLRQARALLDLRRPTAI